MSPSWYRLSHGDLCTITSRRIFWHQTLYLRLLFKMSASFSFFASSFCHSYHIYSLDCSYLRLLATMIPRLLFKLCAIESITCWICIVANPLYLAIPASNHSLILLKVSSSIHRLMFFDVHTIKIKSKHLNQRVKQSTISRL